MWSAIFERIKLTLIDGDIKKIRVKLSDYADSIFYWDTLFVNGVMYLYNLYFSILTRIKGTVGVFSPHLLMFDLKMIIFNGGLRIFALLKCMRLSE